jgi:hypothetical protein
MVIKKHFVGSEVLIAMVMRSSRLTNISEEHVTSIFRVKKPRKKPI